MAQSRYDFNRELIALMELYPPPRWSARYDPIREGHRKHQAEMDIGARLAAKEMVQYLKAFRTVRLLGGSGFQASNQLRYFFSEYLDRIVQHGPESMPTSFGGVQAFLTVHPSLYVFDLLDENEHCVDLMDYLDWYTGNSKVVEDPGVLLDAMEEAEIYSYDFIGDPTEFLVETSSTTLSILALSMIRHGSELSAMLIAGEKPARPTDDEVKAMTSPKTWKTGLEVNQDWTIQDRYLEGLPDFSKVLLLGNFDLKAKSYGIRYVLRDIGTSFMVGTDERSMVPDHFSEELRLKTLEDALGVLGEYDNLFSALTSLLFLPLAFADNSDRIESVEFVTSLFTDRQKRRVAKAIKRVSNNEVHLRRTIRFLQSDRDRTAKAVSEVKVDTPDLTFQQTGYWKPLKVGQIGEDPDGNPIVGRTWVERHETWSARTPEAFVATLVTHEYPDGPNPGEVYVMRSPSHARDVFKVGRTSRDPDVRAAEISRSTGVPTRLEVLCSWKVGDCVAVEKAAHDELARYRLSKRREFFRVSLGHIVSVVEKLVSQK